MKGLPQAMRIRLLQHNPTPTLTNMRDFVHRLHAVQPDQAHDLVAVCSPADHAEDISPHIQLLHSVDRLTATVASLQTSHQKLQAAVEVKDKQHEPLPRGGHRQASFVDVAKTAASTATKSVILPENILGMFIVPSAAAGAMTKPSV